MNKFVPDCAAPILRRIAILILVLACPATASDGVLEINQTCAVETGCFSGDAPGFPVTIDGTAGRSYRLTGDVSVAIDVAGIVISAPYVTLDLSGFEIAGSGACTGSGIDVVCGAIGTSDAVLVLSSAEFVTVRNGTVRNFSRDGLAIEPDGLVQNVLARHNARIGISSGEALHVVGSTAVENGDNGFDLDGGSLVEACTAKGNRIHGVEIDDDGGVAFGTVSTANGARGFDIASGSRYGKNNVSSGNGGFDLCGGGLCSEERLYYLTRDEYLGSEAAGGGVCDPGFHFASIMELVVPASLKYDWVRGKTAVDAGRGAPALSFENRGWVRTGSDAIGNGTDSSVRATANCNLWSTTSGGGLVATRRFDIVGLEAQWFLTNEVSGSCSSAASVWCVQD